jgi:hypothetical protein
MKRKAEIVAPDSPAAAARVVAALLVRDGRVDWRELEFLTRSGAFALLGLSRNEFLVILTRALGESAGRSAPGLRAVEPLLVAITDRRLQLLVAALLVYVAEIDREVGPEESSLVRAAFQQWDISAADLRDQMSVPLARSLGALHGLRRAG